MNGGKGGSLVIIDGFVINFFVRLFISPALFICAFRIVLISCFGWERSIRPTDCHTQTELALISYNSAKLSIGSFSEKLIRDCVVIYASKQVDTRVDTDTVFVYKFLEILLQQIRIARLFVSLNYCFELFDNF